MRWEIVCIFFLAIIMRNTTGDRLGERGNIAFKDKIFTNPLFTYLAHNNHLFVGSAKKLILSASMKDNLKISWKSQALMEKLHGNQQQRFFSRVGKRPFLGSKLKQLRIM